MRPSWARCRPPEESSIVPPAGAGAGFEYPGCVGDRDVAEDVSDEHRRCREAIGIDLELEVAFDGAPLPGFHPCAKAARSGMVADQHQRDAVASPGIKLLPHPTAPALPVPDRIEQVRRGRRLWTGRAGCPALRPLFESERHDLEQPQG